MSLPTSTPSYPIWGYLHLSGAIWSYLELSGATWRYLELSGAIWCYLALPRIIWSHLDLSEAIRANLHAPNTQNTKLITHNQKPHTQSHTPTIPNPKDTNRKSEVGGRGGNPPTKLTPQKGGGGVRAAWRTGIS